MTLKLRALPYEYDALEPHISAATLETHYDKHHRGYLEKVNEAIAGGPLDNQPLDEVVRASEGTLFDNAAQTWNHDFYWRCMSADGGGTPSSAVSKALVEHFGSVEVFKKEFARVAQDEFGSGWAWLVRNGHGDLRIVSTTDAQNPMTQRSTPLLTCDVWEHAYYLDYRNERAKYVGAFLDHLINWRFLEENLLA
jgi:Fe-Mn family superoxide dismutase